jgi:hypothetical protein
MRRWRRLNLFLLAMVGYAQSSAAFVKEFLLKNCIFVVLLVIFGSVVFVGCKFNPGQRGSANSADSTSSVNTETETKLECWEYTTSAVNIERANQLGLEGWELVLIQQVGRYDTMFYKRRLSINKASEE